MKGITLVGLLAVMLAVPALAANEDVYGPKSFRGLEFGSHISKFTGKLVSAKGETKVYRRADDDLMVGDAPLESIEYSFVDDRLCAVELTYSRKANHLRLLGMLTEKYGSFSNIRAADLLIQSWFFGAPDDGIDVKLVLNDQTDVGYVLYTNYCQSSEEKSKRKEVLDQL